jgi:hypothetical protein
MKKKPVINKVRCKYEGTSGNRYGNYTLRFRADEQDLPAMTKALLGIDRNIGAAVEHNGTRLMLGRVAFGGLRIDYKGESVLSLELVDEEPKFALKDIKILVDEYVTLKMAVRI